MHGPPKFGPWSPHLSTQNGSLWLGAGNSANCAFAAKYDHENDCTEDAEARLDSALLSWRQAEQSA